MLSDSSDFRHSDRDTRLRAIAVRAARGVISGADASEMLRLLGDTDKRVQRAAAEALAANPEVDADFDRRIDELLAFGDGRARWGAAYYQARAGRPSAEGLATWIDTLASTDRDLRWAAHNLIVDSAPVFGPALLSALRTAAVDANAQRRKMAFYALRDVAVADEEGAGLALTALDDAQLEVRLAALAAVPVVHADRDRAARAVAAYLGDADPRMQRAAAAALAKLGSTDPVVVEALETAFRAQDAALRRAAARALGRD